MEAVVLFAYDPTKILVLMADSSSYAWGAILLQISREESEKVPTEWGIFENFELRIL